MKIHYDREDEYADSLRYIEEGDDSSDDMAERLKKVLDCYWPNWIGLHQYIPSVTIELDGRMHFTVTTRDGEVYEWQGCFIEIVPAGLDDTPWSVDHL